jgi:hypothetical protein
MTMAQVVAVMELVSNELEDWQHKSPEDLAGEDCRGFLVTAADLAGYLGHAMGQVARLGDMQVQE